MGELVIIRIMVSAIMLSIFGIWYCILKLVDILRHIYKLLDKLVKAESEPQESEVNMTREEMIRRYIVPALKNTWNDEICDEIIKALEQEPKWIPVSERLPDNTDPVNITWVNHDPDSYYADIKDKPFTATGHYCNGRWWWYSATCQDYLDEYGRCDDDDMDDVIEVIAWMPLPEPYKAEGEGIRDV